MYKHLRASECDVSFLLDPLTAFEAAWCTLQDHSFCGFGLILAMHDSLIVIVDHGNCPNEAMIPSVFFSPLFGREGRRLWGCAKPKHSEPTQSDHSFFPVHRSFLPHRSARGATQGEKQVLKASHHGRTDR